MSTAPMLARSGAELFDNKNNLAMNEGREWTVRRERKANVRYFYWTCLQSGCTAGRSPADALVASRQSIHDPCSLLFFSSPLRYPLHLFFTSVGDCDSRRAVDKTWFLAHSAHDT